MTNRYNQPPRGGQQGSGQGWRDREEDEGGYGSSDQSRQGGGMQQSRDAWSPGYRDYETRGQGDYGRGGYEMQGDDYGRSPGQFSQRSGYEWGGERGHQNWGGRGGGGGGQMSQRDFPSGAMGGGMRSGQQGGGYGGESYGSQGYGQQGYGGRDYGGMDTGGYRESDYGRRGMQRGYGNEFDSSGYAGTGYGSNEFGTPGRSGSMGQGTSGRRGPKGWQRTDDRLKDAICERLYNTQHVDSSEVTVDVKDGKVTLEGTVPERGMKHALEDVVDTCPGVTDIDNRVRVSRQEGGSQWQSGQSQSGQSAGSTSGSSSTWGSGSTETGSSASKPRKE